jgi:hypothetical protein
MNAYIREHVAQGFQAQRGEFDYNFGRLGSTYHIMGEAMGRGGMSDGEVEREIDDWLLRASGAPVFQVMKRYYEVAWSGARPVRNEPILGECVLLLAQADDLIPAGTPEQARLNWDFATGAEAATPAAPLVYDNVTQPWARSSPDTGGYAYIPRGVRTLDLEFNRFGSRVADGDVMVVGGPDELSSTGRTLRLKTGERHRITLNPGEDGGLVHVQWRMMPHFNSIPMIWAPTAEDLLVPRAIAEADGLTIIGEPQAAGPP